MSATIRQDEDFAKRYNKLMWRRMLPIIASFPMMWVDVVRGQAGFGTAIGAATFVVGFCDLFVREHRMKRSYRCPQCQKKLPECDYKQDGTTFAYFCPDCDVEWQIPLAKRSRAK